MRVSSSVTRWLLGVVLAMLPASGAAQSTLFSATLRYGSGYFDVPAAAVLPSLALRAGYSGFWVRSDGDPAVGPSGEVTDPGSPRRSFHGDVSLSLGVLGRAEVGATLQSVASRDEGGRILGMFGQLLLLDPAATGFGLAVGARYLGRPDFGDGIRRAPTRLGFPDAAARARFADGRELDTRLTVFGAATLHLPGVEAGWLPDNDVSVTLGYGSGMFREGGDLSWYAPQGMEGWFLAGGMDFALAPETLLVLKAEHAGFDVNLGAEIAWKAGRAGVHVLGVNHDERSSAYRSPKVGFSLSFTTCPLLNRACIPRVRTRAPADTVRLPAPPPDTVVVDTAPATSSEGRPIQLCLATGEDVWVLVTTRGDTLVGPERLPAGDLEPRAALPGVYAGTDPAFDPEATLSLDGMEYRPDGEPVQPGCAALVPWREAEGSPVFRLRDGGPVPEVVYLPLRPGVWQRYRRVSP